MLELQLEVVRNGFVLDAALSCAPGPTSLIGPNGAGKSTLLRAVLGAVPVRRGRVVLEGRVLLDSAAGVELPTEERGVGWVPQEYALFPHLTVRENVVFGARTPAARAAIGELLERLGLTALATRRASALSGGERQKVALARALAAKPGALLLDEPLAALDATTRDATRSFLGDALRMLDIPSLVVTHEMRDVVALGGPVVLLEAGRLRWTGSVDALRASPPNDFARDLAVATVKST